MNINDFIENKIALSSGMVSIRDIVLHCEMRPNSASFCGPESENCSKHVFPAEYYLSINSNYLNDICDKNYGWGSTNR